MNKCKMFTLGVDFLTAPLPRIPSQMVLFFVLRSCHVEHGNANQSKQVQGDLSICLTRKKIHGKIDDLNNVDLVSSNEHSSRKEVFL